MAEQKIGTVTLVRELSPMLAIFRVTPGEGGVFPEYRGGQYIALSRNDCRLTRRIPDEAGGPRYVYELDENGHPKRGTVTHAYSIASAPFESRRGGYLEFYVVLEMIESEMPGRLSESLFHAGSSPDHHLMYQDTVAGNFTLEDRAAGFRNVVFVGTGTGLAPFASMIKQVHHDARRNAARVRYTLLHANRTREELGYHEELLEIERQGRFDFAYVPSISRPGKSIGADDSVGAGRANNLLRGILGMPLKEEEDLLRAGSAEMALARSGLAAAVRPVLPRHHSREQLLDRMDPADTVIMACGNVHLREDVLAIAAAAGMRFEQEEW